MGKNLYSHFYLFFFSVEFFDGVSRGGPYRWSMDRSVRGSVFSGHPRQFLSLLRRDQGQIQPL